MLTLKHCKGRACSRPWEKLHPQGDVKSLSDAMRDEFDDFYYNQQPAVSISSCALGQLLDQEGALEPGLFGSM